jgi:hypothetical protein
MVSFIVKTFNRVPRLKYFILSDRENLYGKRVGREWVICNEPEFTSFALQKCTQFHSFLEHPADVCYNHNSRAPLYHGRFDEQNGQVYRHTFQRQGENFQTDVIHVHFSNTLVMCGLAVRRFKDSDIFA